jgi:DNA-binding LytR/AlgR family response regulator
MAVVANPSLRHPLPSSVAATLRRRVTRVENEVFAAATNEVATTPWRSHPGPVVILRMRGRAIVVEEASIIWIDGAGNYVRFHVGSEQYRVRGTLASLEGVLSRQFVRAHRSTIVNVLAIGEVLHTPFGDLVAVLHGGARLTVGRRFRANLEAAFAARL